METLTWFSLVLIGFLSFIPVLKLYQYKQHVKYRMLRYYVNSIFLWTILTFLLHLTDNLTVVYYLVLLTFPLVFVILCFGFETIQQLFGKKTHKLLIVFAIAFFTLNLFMSLTNEFHLLVKTVPLADIIDKETALAPNFGMFFFVHTAVSYLIVFTVVIKLLIEIPKITGKESLTMPYALISIITVLGVLLNVIYLFVYAFIIDITYIFLVFFGFYLYWLIFNRDFQFRLMDSSRKALVNEMREIYIIADMYGQIIEFSSDLFERLKIPKTNVSILDDFINHIAEHTVLYRAFDAVQDKPFIDKPYLFYVQKELKIPKFNQTGFLVLMYDETRLMKLVDRLNFALKYDNMTQLYNRDHFEKNREYYEKEFPRAAVIMTDINGLKLYNDYYGHEQGDLLIKSYANILRSLSASTVAVYRLGGDEFLVFYHDVETHVLNETKMHLISETEKTDFPLKISVSIGLAQRLKGETLDGLIKRADQNLYTMKKNQSKSFKESFIAFYESNKK